MLPLVSAGADLVGSIFSSMTSASNTKAQIAASQQQQATQNAFQERMSNTAYQRASTDMKEAGLNPMMMFGSGSAASSPSGSSIQAPMPTRTSALGNVGSVIGKALDAQIAQQTFSKLVEETSNLTATRAKILAEKKSEDERPALIRSSTDLTTEEAKRKRQEIIQHGPDTVEKAGVLDLPDSLVRGVGKVKYGVGAVSDVLAPVVSTATRAYGLDLLRKGMSGKSAGAFRRGMDTERRYPSGGSF
ncbi:MAG: DNA pilot protein [Microvirus sp.]|nr:MAG: DNA pilot protein [Microvirus sp.]